MTDTSATISGLALDTAYEVRVRATNDEGDGDWTGDLATQTSSDTNDTPAFDDGAGDDRSVAENTASDTDIGSPVTATDADGDTLTYSVEGTDGASFAIDGATGQLKTKIALDHEAKDSYSVVVRADDSNGGVSTIGVAIAVTDVDEPPDAPAAPKLVAASSATLNVNWNAPSNVGRPAISHYDLRYRISGSSSFSAGPEDVASTTATITDLSAETGYDVQVRATNDEGDSTWSSSLKTSTTEDTTTVTAVMIAADNATATEGADLTFSLTRSGDAAETLTVTVSVTETGNMISGAPPTSVTFAASSLNASLTVATEDDALDESASTVTATVEDGDTYDLGSSATASVTVNDNDDPVSADAQLSSLNLSGIDFGTFESSTAKYEAEVAFAKMQTIVTAVAADPDATFTIGPADVDEDEDGHQVNLSVGDNTISVTVTAADDVTMLTYSVKVKRATMTEEQMEDEESYAMLLTQTISNIVVEAMNVRFVELPQTNAGLSNSLFELSPIANLLPTDDYSPSIHGSLLGESSGNTPFSSSALSMDEVDIFDQTEPLPGHEVSFGSWRHWLSGQSFLQPLNGSSFDDPAKGTWSLWGTLGITRFAHRNSESSLEGSIFTTTIGVDYERLSWLAGVALSYSDGDGDISRRTTRVDAISAMAVIEPYWRFNLSDRIQVWGLLGFGTGTLIQPDYDIESTVDMTLQGVGSRGQIWAGSGGDFAVSLKTDYVANQSVLQNELADTDHETDSSRLRLSLEGSKNWALNSGGRFSYWLEVGMRQDDNEATEQEGVEIASGIQFSSGGSGRVSLGANVRTFKTADEDDETYEEWGAGGTLRISSLGSGRGASVSLTSGWGIADSRVEEMWSQSQPSSFSRRLRRDFDHRLELEFGFGLEAFQSHGLMTPFVGFTRSGFEGEVYRLGSKILISQGRNVSIESQWLEDALQRGGNLRTLLRARLTW